MKINILGGGPAGLYFALLMKRHDPNHDVCVYERGPRDATWGFGVVFSDRALEFLNRDDPAMYRLIEPHMESWPDLTIVHRDVRVPIAGNGFASIGRLELLTLLQDEAERHGVELRFDTDVHSLGELLPADLVVAADGAFSFIREENAEHFGTTVDWRPNRFAWFGTTKAFTSLTLTFRTNEHGVFCAHHYRYAPEASTFLVEVDAATFERAGFAEMDEQQSMRYCERVFAADLDGHGLLSNRSLWRAFPVVWNACWSLDNVVLLGDALRTVHFSIGSGTRLALEDAISLFEALRETDGIPAALTRFQERRYPPTKKLFDAAEASLRWYEQMAEHMSLGPEELAYRYMRRSGRLDHEGVRSLDPALAAAIERNHPEAVRG
jgi:2-polyprenyl-6-methoxyphenol hydroxylase-like FAD-dependent oxidoreductase